MTRPVGSRAETTKFDGGEEDRFTLGVARLGDGIEDMNRLSRRGDAA
jgi:hypothetical protein